MSARIVKLALAAAGLFLSASGSARASTVVTTTSVVHGTNCVGLSSADEARLLRNGFGTYNSSTTTAAMVACPITTPQASNVLQLQVTLYDRSAAAVSCELDYLDNSGNSFFAQQRQTSNINQQPPTSLGFTTLPANAWGMTLICNLPPSGANGPSEITSIQTKLTAVQSP